MGEASSQPTDDVKPIVAGNKRWVLDDILPSLKVDGVYIKGQEKLKKGRMTRAEFRQMVKDVVREKWGVVG